MKVEGVKKIYRTKSGNVEALKGVSFTLPERGMFFILGKSGSGKSTLLNVLSGLDGFDGGSIEVCGRELNTLTKSQLDIYRNSLCGFIFQEYNLIPELSVGENIELSLQLQGKKDNGEKVKEALERVGLSGYERRKVTELSGGQKQRVAIARAIIKSPEIIFADEPTGALDEKTGRDILELLKNLSEKSLVIAVTHDKEYALEYGDGIIEISDGEIVSNSVKAEALQIENADKEWQKSKMPAGCALKIGCSNFKYHSIRLAIAILLAVTAFTLIGIAINIATGNHPQKYFNAIYERGLKYTEIEKYEMSYRDELILEDFFSDDRREGNETEVTVNDLEELKKIYDAPFFLYNSYLVADYQYSFAVTVDEFADLWTPDLDCEITSSGYLHIEEEDCEELGFTVTGRLPENSSQVAISELLLNSFILFGLKEDGIKYKISSAEDIIGHTIHVTADGQLYTVTGVVKTGCSNECYKSHGYLHPHNKIYVGKDFSRGFSSLLCPISANKKEFTQLFDFVLNYDKDNYTYEFYNEISESYYGARAIMAYWKFLCAYISVPVVIIAIGFLINFIAVSLRGQMKQIGILRAMGAGFKDICKIYGGGMLCMCAAVYALSLAVSAIAFAWLNSALKAETGVLFNAIAFSPYVFPVLFALIAVSALIGCVIPLLKFRKKTPIVVLVEGQIK